MVALAGIEDLLEAGPGWETNGRSHRSADDMERVFWSQERAPAGAAGSGRDRSRLRAALHLAPRERPDQAAERTHDTPVAEERAYRLCAVRRQGVGGRRNAMLESLLAPPFAADPPVKMNVPAKTLGLILAILGAIGALFGIFGIFALLGLSAIAAAYGGIFLLAVIGVIIGEIG
ncbi:MAG: hypothetical protein AAB114_01870, partial [Chloroflexota bacterium]